MPVRINLKPLEKFADKVSRDLRGRAMGPIRDAIKQWGARYRSFALLRFVSFSRGGGDWKSLSPTTIARRRSGSGVGQVAAILVDTGTLRSALDVQFNNKPGALEETIPFGVRVGYGGPSAHPGGGATVADIAKFHQEGTSRVPKREIIVEPDAKTVAAMAEDMRRAINKMLKGQI